MTVKCTKKCPEKLKKLGAERWWRPAEEKKAMEAAKTEAEAALQGVQGSNAELAAIAARFERKAALLAKEREGLQKLLASFHTEAQNSGASTKALGVMCI